MWMKSGFGKYICEHCESTLKIKKNPLLAGISIFLGGSAAAIGFYFRSWSIFFLALIIVLAIDAVIDMNFRKLIETPKD